MKFHLRNTADNRWEIHNNADFVLFVGTLDDCQNWLDSHEGASQQTLREKFMGWLRSQADNKSSSLTNPSASQTVSHN